MNHKLSLGIDLGTSNSAVALADVDGGPAEIVELTQILGPNQIGESRTLPSALYIPHPEEFSKDAFPLPWKTAGGDGAIIGTFARDHRALFQTAS